MAHPIRLLAPALAAGLTLFAATASAGTLTLRDEARVFSPGDADELRGVVAHAPYDARLVTTTAYADQASFSRFVGTLVSEPDMVVVGIDPVHHHVQVHFGTGSHIPQAAWPGIERAGNDDFRRGAWEQGSADIFRAASSAAAQAGFSGTTSPAQASGVSWTGPLLLLLLVGGVIVAVVLFARRRSPGYVDPGGYGAGPYAGGPGPYPGGGPYYGAGMPPGGGGIGPVGGGVIGAGLGGVVGYELGKMEGEREERARDRGNVGVFDNSGTTDYGGGGGGSFDAGGGGSSWDDSSSGGTTDFGGGGSDFGGGGSDFGGGSSDGGGGGSDF